MQTHEKIVFELEQDEDGYPPVGWEGVWAVPLGYGIYEIDNIPYFIRGFSTGDKVRAEFIEGELRYVEFVEASGNTTYRIFVTQEALVPRIVEELTYLGVQYEGTHIPRLVALSVPAQVDLAPIRAYLEAGEASGLLDYEEAAIRHGSGEVGTG